MPDRPAIDVDVRIVWAEDGVEWIDGRAIRWTTQQVFVAFWDTRLAAIGAWVAPLDVRRPRTPGVESLTDS